MIHRGGDHLLSIKKKQQVSTYDCLHTSAYEISNSVSQQRDVGQNQHEHCKSFNFHRLAGQHVWWRWVYNAKWDLKIKQKKIMCDNADQ